MYPVNVFTVNVFIPVICEKSNALSEQYEESDKI